MAQMLRELPRLRRSGLPLRVAPAPPAATAAGRIASTCQTPPTSAWISRRVIDSRDVPALLERAASVLDAKGIILWIAEAGATTLRPSISHGYPTRC